MHTLPLQSEPSEHASGPSPWQGKTSEVQLAAASCAARKPVGQLRDILDLKLHVVAAELTQLTNRESGESLKHLEQSGKPLVGARLTGRCRAETAEKRRTAEQLTAKRQAASWCE